MDTMDRSRLSSHCGRVLEISGDIQTAEPKRRREIEIKIPWKKVKLWTTGIGVAIVDLTESLSSKMRAGYVRVGSEVELGVWKGKMKQA